MSVAVAIQKRIFNEKKKNNHDLGILSNSSDWEIGYYSMESLEYKGKKRAPKKRADPLVLALSITDHGPPYGRTRIE